MPVVFSINPRVLLIFLLCRQGSLNLAFKEQRKCAVPYALWTRNKNHFIKNYTAVLLL